MSPVLVVSARFQTALDGVRDPVRREQILKKLNELRTRQVGKRLQGCPYWSVHVNSYRIIYRPQGDRVIVVHLLERKHDYRDLP